MTGTIGFVGLGNMGTPMASRLVGMGELTVFDLDPRRTGTLEALGASVALSARQVADRASVVFCSLPTPRSVETALLGPDGVIEGSAVEIVVDLSTTGPQVSARVAAALRARSIGFLDAPVSGGVPGAADGTLTVITAGGDGAFEAVEPLLRRIGTNIFRVGDQPGQAQMMKLVNNMLIASCAVASFEVLVVGAKAGLDPRTMLDVINVSSGRNWVTMHKVEASILGGDFPAGFATELLLKDVSLGVTEAEALGVPLGVVNRAREFLAFAVSQGDGKRDYATIIRHLEHWAGVEVRG